LSSAHAERTHRDVVAPAPANVQKRNQLKHPEDADEVRTEKGSRGNKTYLMESKENGRKRLDV